MSRPGRRAGWVFRVVPQHGPDLPQCILSLSKAKSFDLGNYSKGQTRMVRFTKPGIVLVNCRLHTNMSAVVVVAPNRFYASPEKGRFTIPDVPAGKYAWPLGIKPRAF